MQQSVAFIDICLAEKASLHTRVFHQFLYELVAPFSSYVSVHKATCAFETTSPYAGTQGPVGKG